jgi:hypothetical protein
VQLWIGNPAYSLWAQEGYCSLGCFEAHPRNLNATKERSAREQALRSRAALVEQEAPPTREAGPANHQRPQTTSPLLGYLGLVVILVLPWVLLVALAMPLRTVLFGSDPIPGWFAKLIKAISFGIGVAQLAVILKVIGAGEQPVDKD